MIFCEGDLGETERLMKQIPNFDKSRIRLPEKDCRLCKRFDSSIQSCRLDYCPVYDAPING